MMTLWGRKSSINVQKVLWVLAELGLDEGSDFKQIDAGLHFGINKTPDYLKLNPNGLVPTLEDGALVLWESNTIMRYLAKKYDSNNAFPDDLASQASSEKWMDWQISTLWPSLRVPFLGLTRVPEEERDYTAIKNAFQESNRLLGIFDGVLANQAFCSGSKFNLGDITIALCVKRWIML
ncbi:MAG: glutathione S-transferase family protein, partial [Burkholderiaceae bacterium]|nr:glutathione S-transferase family protein [Burkholderiaceae bacterium]